MIFVSGIHGVGKTYFCDLVKNQLGINHYSASQLITERRHQFFSEDKLVPDIDDNQPLLIDAIDELRTKDGEFILDGHFCLLDAHGNITRIPPGTYSSLKPDRMVLLTEKPDIIADRRRRRDGILQEASEIAAFQKEEQTYAEEISNDLGIPLIVSTGANDLQRVIDWIQAGGC